MAEFKGKSQFGHASKCNSLAEVVALLKDVVGDDARKCVAAFGMLLAANSTGGGGYRSDALKVLTALAYAKAELDSSMCHTTPTITVTSSILARAQAFAEETTIPCTEWPSSDEVIENVLENAMTFSEVKEWKRVIRHPTGAAVGVELMGDI